MKFKYPSAVHKKSIQACLLETLSNRRQWILEQGPSIGQIHEVYPRLWDYKGDMVCLILLMLLKIL